MRHHPTHFLRLHKTSSQGWSTTKPPGDPWLQTPLICWVDSWNQRITIAISMPVDKKNIRKVSWNIAVLHVCLWIYIFFALRRCVWKVNQWPSERYPKHTCTEYYTLPTRRFGKVTLQLHMLSLFFGTPRWDLLKHILKINAMAEDHQRCEKNSGNFPYITLCFHNQQRHGPLCLSNVLYVHTVQVRFTLENMQSYGTTPLV